MSVDHYENFPVASFLCPSALRPAVTAIYHYARTADDIADEGIAGPTERLADLSAYRTELRRVAQGGAPTPRWAAVFEPLAAAIASFQLPLQLLEDLLSAFEQDVTKTRYAHRAELLDYCRRSANPVGRLLLHLYGVREAESLQQSDAICTALQLINFWQDLSIDLPRGRLYIPLDQCAAHGLADTTLFARHDSGATRALVQAQCDWARALMLSGAPLVHRVPGRAGWELRGVVQGGLRILDKIAALQFATLRQRPRLGVADMAPIVWRACRMQVRR
ncbi:squalene synthase HpnC [Methylibium sp.]|uniref:squalene synthase HpnC n=1 Tax=Methylibium sp. TaxID=2067992 RepID=UPI003D098B0A